MLVAGKIIINSSVGIAASTAPAYQAGEAFSAKPLPNLMLTLSFSQSVHRLRSEDHCQMLTTSSTLLEDSSPPVSFGA
jgi:hypothetical protein